MYGTNILGITDPKDLRDLWPDDFVVRSLTADEFRHIAELCGALWLHAGDPCRPHAELTSGKCSNGFVNVLEILKFPNLCDILARQMWRTVCAAGVTHADWVVGSDHASATLSYAVAREFRAKHDFAEKGPDKAQTWKRFVIEPGEVVLQVEELMTTSGTLAAVRQGVRQGNPHPVTFAPVVVVLVHRSDVHEIEGSPVVHFVHYDIKVWDPADCPLCKAGSKRLRPKQNWAELTGSTRLTTGLRPGSH